MKLPDLKPGDWLRCTLPELTSIYGTYCRVIRLPDPVARRGAFVAFPPMREGWKPYRTALDDGHWVRPDDAVTLLGWVAAR